jgi:hypothetical protein
LREWKTKNEMRAGYVTEFEVEDGYASRFEPHNVGSHEHEQLWVPAEELATFNMHILGTIRVIEAYFGADFTGYIPERFGLKGKNAIQRLIPLRASFNYSPFDVWMEIAGNCPAIFLHFPFWSQREFEQDGIARERKDEVLQSIQQAWTERYLDLALCYATSI